MTFINKIRFTLLICAGFFGASGLIHAQNYDIQQVGTITSPALEEISGIAPSLQYDNRLWGINDSGNSPSLYSIGVDGILDETWTVEGVVNDDWEEIGWVHRKGESFLFIADVGDNASTRSFVRIHLIRSTDLISNGSLKVTPAYSFAFQYSDGPRDCEAVSYDPVEDRFLFISKQSKPPVLYELPLHPIKSRVLRKATRVTDVTGFPKPAEGDNLIKSKLIDKAYQSTAMDFSPIQDRAALLTYGPLLIYKKSPSMDWPTAFQMKPTEIPLPIMRQVESVCFSKDGKSIYITSEKVPAPIFRVDLK
ncbi:hypothetical protein HQ585_06305 [candidate division KSB1 bacterium]|nr:hypothetical protein [candidate division KSB1 bacterium]